MISVRLTVFDFYTQGIAEIVDSVTGQIIAV